MFQRCSIHMTYLNILDTRPQKINAKVFIFDIHLSVEEKTNKAN